MHWHIHYIQSHGIWPVRRDQRRAQDYRCDEVYDTTAAGTTTVFDNNGLEHVCREHEYQPATVTRTNIGRVFKPIKIQMVSICVCSGTV